MDNYIDLNNFEDIPVVPLRGLVVYPNMTLHFDVGRKKSVAALNTAMDTHQMIFLVSQIDSSIEDPSERDVYEVGVICKVKQMIKIPNSSNLRVIVEGIARASIVTMYTDGDHFNAVVDRAPIYDVEVSA